MCKYCKEGDKLEGGRQLRKELIPEYRIKNK